MQTCNWIDSQIDDFLDDRLPPTAQHELEQHIAACSPCRATVLRQQALIADLAGLGAAADRVAGGPAKMPEVRRSSAPWRIAAAILVVAGLGYGLNAWRHRGGSVAQIEPSEQPTDIGRGAPDLETPLVVLGDGANRMAVRLPSSDPGIHIVWLYDTVTQDKAPRRAPQTPGAPPRSSPAQEPI